MKKILVCGIPRSGTTWISKVLSCNPEVRYIHEPDNEHQNLFGITYKDALRRFPYLSENDSCQSYKKLFEKAYSGYFLEPYGKPSNIIREVFSLELDELEQRIGEDGFRAFQRNDALLYMREQLLRGSIHLTAALAKFRSLVAEEYQVKLMKSVHCILALDFLNKELNISHNLIIFRHPASIIASHLRMDNKDIWRPILQQDLLWKEQLEPFKSRVQKLDDPLVRAGARIGAIYYLFKSYLEMNNCRAVKYETVCRNKVRQFEELYNALNLNWNRDVEEYIHQLNRKGEGYDVNRIADKQIDKWKQELSEPKITSVEKGYRIFPLELQYSFS